MDFGTPLILRFQAAVLVATGGLAGSGCGGSTPAPLAEALTIAGTSCPETTPMLPHGRSTSQGLILPSDVSALRLCRVARLANGPQASVRVRVVRKRRAKRIVHELDHLPAGPSGPINCPTSSVRYRRGLLTARPPEPSWLATYDCELYSTHDPPEGDDEAAFSIGLACYGEEASELRDTIAVPDAMWDVSDGPGKRARFEVGMRLPMSDVAAARHLPEQVDRLAEFTHHVLERFLSLRASSDGQVVPAPRAGT